MTLAQMLADDAVGHEEIAAWLNGMTHEGRMEALGSTNKAQQKALWEKVADAPGITYDHFIPDSVGPLEEVIHHGRNTLPFEWLKPFQKRFARPSDGSARAFGYNHASTRGLIGPGYFVLVDTDGRPEWESRGAWVVDYFQVPDGDVVEGWPKVVPNSQGLQMFVYKNTRDFMRKVSDHVSIGMAFKNEKSLNNWFTLIRED